MEFTETALLASIDHTLASVRAALYAAADPEQLQEAQAQLAEKAGEDTGRLVSRADESAREGDLREIERRLAAAREMLGGPSALRHHPISKKPGNLNWCRAFVFAGAISADASVSPSLPQGAPRPAGVPSCRCAPPRAAP
ncbi:hypothetical protein BH23GEM5_BH23GEM5_28060 [soil metagenome]